MKPLLSKEEIADLLAPLEPEPETKTKATDVAGQSAKNGAKSLHNEPLQFRVEVAHSKLLFKELLHIKQGSIVRLDAFTGKPLDLYIDNHLIARCELVQVGDTISIKVNEVTFPAELLSQLEKKSTSC